MRAAPAVESVAVPVTVPGLGKKRASTLEEATFTKSFTSADLQPSKDDYGYLVDRFIVDMEVIVFFTSGPIGGTVTSKNRRAGTICVTLDTKTPTKVTVPCRAVVPAEDAESDDDYDD